MAVLRRLLRHYGAGPLHLLALLGSFAFAGYVVDRVTTVNDPVGIGIWFAATLVAHDLFLFPLYSLADRSLGLRARRHPERLPRVPWINHVRMPVVVSAVLLLVSFPLVFRIDASDYRSATGLNPDPYLARWLLITAALFAASAVLYAVRLGRAHRHQPGTRRPPAPAPPPTEHSGM
jgi:hypothetical protein